MQDQYLLEIRGDMADMGASSALESAKAPAEALADPDKISYMIHPQVDRAFSTLFSPSIRSVS